MRRTNIFFGTSALLVAAGAIGAGVLVSTNAMAASGDLGPNALTIGMVTVGTNGDAYECTFDAASMPSVNIGPVAVGGANAAAPAGATSGDVIVSGSGSVPQMVSGSVSVVPNGSLPPALPVPLGSGVITLQGTASADGTSSVSQVAADGTVTPVKVRQGTAEECAAAKQGAVLPVGAPQAPTDVSGNAPTDTAVNPKG
jgi:hypothetical protein